MCRWLIVFGFLPVIQGWVDGDFPRNESSLNLVRFEPAQAISDGELRVAQSDVTFDRRPAYINGKDGPVNNGGASKAVDNGKGDYNKDVLETHQTTCQVTTEQLVASAQATVTRVMKGLCTSKELEERFTALETTITDRLNELKNVIFDLEARVDDYNEALRRGKYQQMETLFEHCNKTKSPQVESLSAKGTQGALRTPSADVIENETEPMNLGPRESEIEKYNSSISMDQDGHSPPKKVFTYYWRIPQIHHKLTEMHALRSVRSSSFYVYLGGYRMYLRSYPRQGEKNFFVHVGVTKGEFDEALKWPFALKLRVHILDQTPNNRVFEDIASRTWDPTVLCSEFNWQKPTKGDNYECVGLGFPQDLLFHRKYIYSDSLVVKLSVYLDS